MSTKTIKEKVAEFWEKDRDYIFAVGMLCFLLSITTTATYKVGQISGKKEGALAFCEEMLKSSKTKIES